MILTWQQFLTKLLDWSLKPVARGTPLTQSVGEGHFLPRQVVGRLFGHAKYHKTMSFNYRCEPVDILPHLSFGYRFKSCSDVLYVRYNIYHRIARSPWWWNLFGERERQGKSVAVLPQLDFCKDCCFVFLLNPWLLDLCNAYHYKRQLTNIAGVEIFDF